MRLALISDIHGNALALQSVLDAIEKTGVDQVVCLGDIATLGPRPAAALEQLQALECPCILGNHDEFMFVPELVHTYTKHQAVIDAIAWCRDQLSQDAVEFMQRCPRTLELPLEDGTRLLLFHGTPNSNTTDLLPNTPAEVVDEMLLGHDAAVLAGGHTHLQMLRQHRGRLIVNAGSVGMPFETHVAGRPPVVLPHAEFAIVESTPRAIAVQLHRVALDKAALRAAALEVRGNPICAALADIYA